jgi:hypothetical protein
MVLVPELLTAPTVDISGEGPLLGQYTVYTGVIGLPQGVYSAA